MADKSCSDLSAACPKCAEKDEEIEALTDIGSERDMAMADNKALRADNERLRVENGELRLLLREAAGQCGCTVAERMSGHRLDCWMTHAMADRLLSHPTAEGVEG